MIDLSNKRNMINHLYSFLRCILIIYYLSILYSFLEIKVFFLKKVKEMIIVHFHSLHIFLHILD